MFDQNRLHNLISAIQKAIRWGEVNEARCFSKELIDMQVPHTVLGQLRIIAAEDIGLADPSMVGYMNECSDNFENLLKMHTATINNAKRVPEIIELLDSAVIAEAISFKSRILPMATFWTLFEIYKKENFKKGNHEYFKQFEDALQNSDERQALYYAIILEKFTGDKRRIRSRIRSWGQKQNADLIDSWMLAYERYENLLTFTGSILLLCRSIDPNHGEYKGAVGQYLTVHIGPAEIPDRAYDMHTITGKKMGRGLHFFFNVSGTVKNERFPNDWAVDGKNAYYSADKEKLANEDDLIKAIKSKQKPSTGIIEF